MLQQGSGLQAVPGGRVDAASRHLVVFDVAMVYDQKTLPHAPQRFRKPAQRAPQPANTPVGSATNPVLWSCVLSKVTVHAQHHTIAISKHAKT